jgi:phosphoenolpyruvate synthase/pyruvate phosphate dikinase
MRKVNFKGFFDKKWEFVYSRRMSYQKVRLYAHGYWKDIPDNYGWKQGWYVYRIKKGNCFNYWPLDESRGLENHLFKNFQDLDFLSRAVKNWPRAAGRRYENYYNFAKKLPQDFSRFSNAKLLRILTEYYEQDKKIAFDFWVLFESIERPLTPAIKEVFKKSKFNQRYKIDEILIKLSQPLKITPPERAKQSLLEISLLPAAKRAEALKKHWQIFACEPMYDIDYDFYTLEYFTKKLKKLLALTVKERKKELREIDNKYSARKKYFYRIMKIFRRDKRLLILLNFFASCAYLKDFKPYYRDFCSFRVRPLFAEVAKRLDLSLWQALFIFEEEIAEALQGRLKIDKKKIDRRIADSVYLCEYDKIENINDKKSLKRIDALLSGNEENKKELKGLAVFPGKVSGKVSLIISNNDLSKFKKGEILVASATRPDFVPLMKKAKAIVTNEGGLLSHAAIISRELKIPCVVGTKIATQVLRDGMTVEVDAGKGVVKIIN